MISVFDIFKIGIGPSSSHTVGPMKAGKQFTDDLIARGMLHDVTRVVVDVYGSLSLTGKGHHTDIAIIMGLAGNLPDTVDIDTIPDSSRTSIPMVVCCWQTVSMKLSSRLISA
jgi:L-serine dehydratase